MERGSEEGGSSGVLHRRPHRDEGATCYTDCYTARNASVRAVNHRYLPLLRGATCANASVCAGSISSRGTFKFGTTSTARRTRGR